MAIQINDTSKAREFYDETKQWQSEVNTQVIDLMFFQRILDIYGLKAAETGDAADVVHLKRTLTSFLEYRVEGHKKLLRDHEEYLLKIVEDRVLLKDREFPFKHQDIGKEVQDFRVGAQSLKTSLYEKIERLKNF
jgi:hypothetical protein